MRGTIAVHDARASHGYAIAVRLGRLSKEVLNVEEGSLYPALYRRERRGWLSSSWAETETGRRARFYKLTRAGRAQLAADRIAAWLPARRAARVDPMVALRSE